jgi:quercetin dioxygenase-like cupin family protein
MTAVKLEAGVFDGRTFERVRYPAEELLLRVISAGNVQVAEYTSEDREGPPPHRHAWHELQYVIEGTVEFLLDGRWIAGGPGTVQTLPPGISHSVRIPAGSARVLMVTIGAPFDGFARDMARLLSTRSPAPDTVVEVAGRHGVRLDDPE